MRIGSAHRANTETFLVHVFGRGLDDERYVVEKYRTLADGRIRPVPPEQENARGRRGRKRTIVSAGEVKTMRPGRDEIIVCTAVKLAGSGVQYWGSAACGLFIARNAR